MLMAISLFFVGLQRRHVEVAVTVCVVVGVLYDPLSHCGRSCLECMLRLGTDSSEHWRRPVPSARWFHARHSYDAGRRQCLARLAIDART